MVGRNLAILHFGVESFSRRGIEGVVVLHQFDLFEIWFDTIEDSLGCVVIGTSLRNIHRLGRTCNEVQLEH